MFNLNIIHDLHIDMWRNGEHKRLEFNPTPYIKNIIIDGRKQIDYSLLNLTGTIRDLRTTQ